jgi:hypothetical protein
MSPRPSPSSRKTQPPPLANSLHQTEAQRLAAMAPEEVEEEAIGSRASSPNSDAPPPQEALHEIPVEPLIPPAPEADAVPAVRIMDRDKFFDFFCSLFVFGGNLYAMVPPLNVPLQSLTRAPSLPSARPASDALYDMAEKFDWLHWLIEEDADYMKALVFIGAFAVQLGANVAAELRSHRETIAAMEQDAAMDERRAQQAPPQPQPN